MGIYLWFKIYFLIDTNAKMWTEITDIVVFRKKLLKFLQGVLADYKSPVYFARGLLTVNDAGFLTQKCLLTTPCIL